MRPHGHLPLLLIAAAVALAACSQSADSETLGQLQDDLAAQAESQQSLRSRIEDLEQVLGGIRGEDGDAADQVDSLRDQLASMQEQLTSLEGSIPELREQLDADEIALEDLAAELRGGLATLEGQLAELEDTVEGLRGVAQRTREDLDLLEQRLETHLRNHGD